MPEVLPDHAPNPIAVIGWDGTRYRVFSVNAAGQLQVDVIASGLPLGAATLAQQLLQTAALQLIDNLVVALGGPGNVRLQVRGEDQLFSIEDTLTIRTAGAISGADGYLDAGPVPPGELWMVTTIAARDVTSPTTAHDYTHFAAATGYDFFSRLAAIAANETTYWGGFLPMKEGGVVRVYFIGGLVADQVRVFLNGYRMTLET